MRVSLMKNTTIFCLKALAAGGWLNPRTIARIRWPQSQQTEKKAATIRAHLDTLVRHGFALRLNDYYVITDTGNLAAEMASEGKRPLMLGLA
jgi:hypothetical protein